MIGWLFLALLVAVSTFVFRFGGREERIVLAALLTGFFGTVAFFGLGTADWLQPQIGIMLLDTGVLGVLLFIAFRSKRFWPLPVAAFHVITVLTEIAGLFGQNVVSYALGVAQGAWSYLQLLVLVIATVRTRRRAKTETKTSSSSPI